MTGRAKAHQLVAHERLLLEQVVVPEPSCDTEVCVAAQEKLANPLPVHNVEAELDLRVRSVECGQRIWQDVNTNGGVSGNPDRSAAKADDGVQRFARFAYKRKDSAGPLVEGRSHRCQLQGSAPSVEEWVAQRGGEGLDLVRDRRLAERKRLRRPGVALEVDDRLEHPELVKGDLAFQGRSQHEEYCILTLEI